MSLQSEAEAETRVAARPWMHHSSLAVVSRLITSEGCLRSTLKLSFADRHPKDVEAKVFEAGFIERIFPKKIEKKWKEKSNYCNYCDSLSEIRQNAGGWHSFSRPFPPSVILAPLHLDVSFFPSSSRSPFFRSD